MAVNRGREAWKTYGNVFDQHSEQLLRKLAAQGYFEELVSAIALGKEANVFTARTKDDSFVAVKIYRLENCNFNKMFEYISQDPRYLDLKGQKRRIIFTWTQREYRNLMKAREQLRVPTPLAFKDNIIVMEYINEGDKAASQLKDVVLDHPQRVFDEILLMVKQLYTQGLVHGDLSPYNILVQHAKPVFIDFSQSTATNSPNARELLLRDLTIISNFFKKQGVKSDPELLLKQVIS
ncbi:serine protein kinase RIO [Candidatus Woesearchaeota archaeon]|nr:serine protein kinase RIO [Candidatus Woesearchaeota archaeon]